MVSASMLISPMPMPVFALDEVAPTEGTQQTATVQKENEPQKQDVVQEEPSEQKVETADSSVESDTLNNNNVASTPQKAPRWCLHMDGLKSTWVTDSVTPATCAEYAIEHQRCTKCGATQDVKDILGGKLDHDWSKGDDIKVVTRPTCVAIGTGSHYCKNCGRLKLDGVVIPALGHNWVITKDAVDIGNVGNYDTDVSHTVKCTRCGILETRFHTYHAATCTEPEKCDCGHKKLNSKPLGHDFSATWFKNEDTHWHQCSRCDVKKDEAAHDWDNGVITKAPTDDENGVRTFTCTVCGQTKTESLAKVTWKSGYGNNATLHTEIVKKGNSYEDVKGMYTEEPTRENYDFEGWTNTTDGHGNITITAQWKRIQLSAKWVDEDGKVMFEEFFNKGDSVPTAGKHEVPDKDFGEDYNYIKEWNRTADTAGNVTYKATYTKIEKQVTATWKSGYGENETLFTQTIGKIMSKNDDRVLAIYDAEPTRENYNFVKWILSRDNEGNVTVTAQWTAQTATVRWVDEDGTTVLDSRTYERPDGIPAAGTYAGEIPTKPADENATYSFDRWSEAVEAENGDVTYTAMYVGLDIPVAPEEPTTPVTPPTTDGGNNGGGNPGNAGGGDGAAVAAAPAGTAALVAVADGATPLANVDANDNLREVQDEDTPLSKGPAGYWALLNLLLAIFTVVSSVVLLVLYFKGKKDDDEEDEDEEEKELKRKGIYRLLSIIPAVVSVVLFFLTENMSLPMILVDEWTLWMAVIAVVNVVLAILSKKKFDDADDEDNRVMA